MLKIRLQRIGRKNEPHFRAVVTDSRNAPKSGRFIEIVGSYNPKMGVVSFDKDRVTHWMGKGALPSDTLHNFLVSQGIIEGKKRNVLPKKTYTKPAEPVVEAKPEPVVAPASEPVAETPLEESTPVVEEVAPVVEETPAEVAPEPETAPVEETPTEEVPAEPAAE